MKKSFLTYFKRLDIFGSGVNFTFNGESSYKSVCGAILTIIVFFLTLFQFNEKFIILINNGDTNHTQRIEFGVNDVSDVIGYRETGFNFAFGIVPNNFNTEGLASFIDDMTAYIDIVVYQQDLSINQAGQIIPERKEIKFRPCRESDK